ncbi:MAG: membrane protein insertion efficiency factor YidD [Candidatus Eremiobacteraeota bacterium]|nr:membrane protein insertion efficiency factor YidD [Candidatus Eremiobacteraeota bacterium]MCW5866951.1 membrane protein insertion efficiency factor YidD [Candidatus Eremiobacteraeota bacterium]
MKAGIRLYKDYISEDYNSLRQSRCMFAPTCSSYAQESIAKHGPIHGLRDGFEHLGQCNTKHHAEQLSAFLGTLGQPGPMDKLTFETPEVEARLRQLEGQVEELAQQAQKGPTPQLQAQFGHVVADMQQNLHVATIQHPGKEPEGFHISASTAMAPLRPLQDRNWLQTGIASLAGATLATIGAAAGGLFLLAIGQSFKDGVTQGFNAGKILGRNLADRVTGVDKLPNQRQPLEPLANTKKAPNEVIPGSWKLLALVDATSADLEPQRTRKFLDVQQPGVTAQIRRVGHTPGHLQAKGIAQLAGAGGIVAASVGLNLLLGASGWGLALGAAGSLITAGSLASRGLGNLHLAKTQGQIHQEPAWTGTRTWAHQQTVQTNGHAPQTPEQIEQLMPGAEKTILNLDGHGKDNRTVGGLTLDKLPKSEAVVLEACHTADLDNLRNLADKAAAAVVSQDSMWEAGLPWSYMLPRLDEMGADGRSWATSVVQRHGGNEYVPTLSAIDLHKIEDLGKSVDRLREKLQHAYKNGHKREIQRARDMTTKFSRLGQQTHNPAQWIFKATELQRDGDLGSWLANLERSCSDPEVIQAAHQARQLLQETVLANRFHNKPTSGLSIELPEFNPLLQAVGRLADLMGKLV